MITVSSHAFVLTIDHDLVQNGCCCIATCALFWVVVSVDSFDKVALNEKYQIIACINVCSLNVTGSITYLECKLLSLTTYKT